MDNSEIENLFTREDLGVPPIWKPPWYVMLCCSWMSQKLKFGEANGISSVRLWLRPRELWLSAHRRNFLLTALTAQLEGAVQMSWDAVEDRTSPKRNM